MLESLSSKAILSKVKAMQGRMLTTADYEQLLHRSSVPACAAYLKAHPAYAGVLRDVQETQIHRGALEALLNKTLFEQFLRLEHYAGRRNAFFHSYQLARLEIRCIINCARLFGSDDQNEFMQSVPGYVVGHLSFDVLALGNVHSFGELLAALQRTPYARVLGSVRPGAGEELSLPVLEHALYLYYYELVHRLIDQSYHGRTAQELHQIFTFQAQLYNLATIYRLKRTFGQRPEEIERLVLPYHGRIPRRVMREIISAPDDEAMLDLLSRTRYGDVFEREHFSYIEFGTGTIHYRLARRFLTFSQNPATVFVAFMTLREFEIENLTNIIEGVRYGLDASQIRPLLIQSGGVHGGA